MTLDVNLSPALSLLVILGGRVPLYARTEIFGSGEYFAAVKL